MAGNIFSYCVTNGAREDYLYKTSYHTVFGGLQELSLDIRSPNKPWAIFPAHQGKSFKFSKTQATLRLSTYHLSNTGSDLAEHLYDRFL